jgi:hypothetical protein
VYNPSHLGGLFSTFNSDAVRDVRVIKGAFPAEYGSRLSSVIDITMKEGSKEKLSGMASISLIASRLTLEGPITEDCTFMISGRRTYLDLIVNAIVPTAPKYYFYDLNTKINYKLGENDRLFLSGYFGRDVVSTVPGSGFDAGIDWGNATGNLRWMHIDSPELFRSFSLVYTDYQFGTNLSFGSSPFRSLSQIRDFTFKGDAEWFPNQQHSVKAGFEATYHNFRTLVSADNDAFNGVLNDPTLGLNGTIGGVEAAVYVQDDYADALGVDGLTLSGGLRFAYFQPRNRFFLEPRVSGVYDMGERVVGENFRLKGAFAVVNQFLHLVVRNDITLPTDTWFPSTDKIAPSNSTQFVLGAETTFFNRELLVSVEGYYKTMNNLLEYSDDATFNIFNTREQDLTVGKGVSYGAEVFVNKRAGAFTRWIGYTLSWTTRQFDELNNGRPFSPRYDTRHDIYITANYKLSDGWELGATWMLTSGQAFTMPAGQYYFNPNAAVSTPNNALNQLSRPTVYRHYTERNGYRLPAFHKLDVNITHYFSWFGLPFNAYLSVYNAYNRRNPFLWAVTDDFQGRTKVQQITLLPIIPTFGIGFKF